MPAYLIGQITVKDDELWQQYVAGVQEALMPFAATILFRGELNAVLAGRYEYEHVVVIEFSDQATLDEWFHSERYQSMIPLRDQAADVVITSYKT